MFVNMPRILGTSQHFSTDDEDPGLRIESFAVINLRGVSTSKTIIYFSTALLEWSHQYC
jgi:hypothetical protein